LRISVDETRYYTIHDTPKRRQCLRRWI